MPRAKSFLKGGLLLVCLGLLGFAGKKAGQQLARSGIVDRATPAPKSAKESPEPQEKTRKRESARAGLAAASLKRLRALEDGSPDLRMDWEARAKMDEIIAKLNAAELAEIYATLGVSQRTLAMKVGAAWMAKDPDAALRGMVEKNPDEVGGLARQVFGAWAQDAPETALAWLNSAEMPEQPADLREMLRMAAITGLLDRDFELATGEYLKLKAPSAWNTRATLSRWGWTYADDPLMRGKLLEFAKTTGNPRDHAELNNSVLRAWPQDDSAGMMSYLYELKDYLESGSAPAEMRPEVDGTAVAAAIYREYDQPALEWWMQRYGQSREVPEAMRGAMVQWVQKYPDKMQQWLDSQASSPQRDALASSVVPALARQGKFTEAAQTVEAMQDPAIRQAASERLGLLWAEKDADAAAAWRKGREGE